MLAILRTDHHDDPFRPSRRERVASSPEPVSPDRSRKESERMVGSIRLPRTLRHLTVLPALVVSGCSLVPREQMEECHRLSQTLRSENAQLKDQMLALRSQNQDYAERAVDDARRLSQLEQANLRLETSVQAYQDERSRLEAAYKDLRASLPQSLRPLALKLSDENRVEQGSFAEPETDKRVGGAEKAGSSSTLNRRKRPNKDAHAGDGWVPSSPKGGLEPAPDPAQAPLTWD
jgi:hypothetical protein